MFYVVTLSLRTVSTVRLATSFHSLNSGHDVAATTAEDGQLPLKHRINHEFVHSLLLGLSQPMPDHITFPARPDVLPTRILLFYFDESHGRAAAKRKAINDTFCINGRRRRVIADFEHTAETELRAFVQAGGTVNNMAKLRKGHLITFLILGDYRKAISEQIRIKGLHTRLEEKTAKLLEEARELKFVEMRLINANSKVRRLTARIKDIGRHSVGKSVDGPKHRYPTRYSLTSSVVGQDEDA